MESNFVGGMTLADIWFPSDTHYNNFIKLIKKFKAARNPEYAAACYILAHPEIFNRVDWEKCIDPFTWYWGKWIGQDENDPNGYFEESQVVSKLSSSYRSLVRAAVELFCGNKVRFDLMAFISNADDDVYRIFIQSLEIRRDRSLVSLD